MRQAPDHYYPSFNADDQWVAFVLASAGEVTERIATKLCVLGWPVVVERSLAESAVARELRDQLGLWVYSEQDGLGDVGLVGDKLQTFLASVAKRDPELPEMKANVAEGLIWTIGDLIDFVAKADWPAGEPLLLEPDPFEYVPEVTTKTILRDEHLNEVTWRNALLRARMKSVIEGKPYKKPTRKDRPLAEVVDLNYPSPGGKRPKPLPSPCKEAVETVRRVVKAYLDDALDEALGGASGLLGGIELQQINGLAPRERAWALLELLVGQCLGHLCRPANVMNADDAAWFAGVIDRGWLTDDDWGSIVDRVMAYPVLSEALSSDALGEPLLVPAVEDVTLDVKEDDLARLVTSERSYSNNTPDPQWFTSLVEEG